MWEPRGHADMYGAVITPSRTADFDVFFLHNEGYSTMCGHAVIALTRLVLEAGLMPPDTTEVLFDVPCGLIAARADMEQGFVTRSYFRNVPSYVALANAIVEVPGLGSVPFDIAYGGAYYAIVEAHRLDLALECTETDRLIDLGRRIKNAVMTNFPVSHPDQPDLSFLYGTIFTGPASDPAHHSRNVCIFADGEVDRSPTGSGVSARAALHYARGELALNETIRIESILGSTMDVTAIEATRFANGSAIIPEVSGTSAFIGKHTFWIEPGDSLKHGFLLR